MTVYIVVASEPDIVKKFDNVFSIDKYGPEIVLGIVDNKSKPYNDRYNLNFIDVLGLEVN